MPRPGTVGLVAALLAVLGGCGRADVPAAVADSAGDRGRGKIALRQYACPTCHVIPGMVEAEGRVGPPLDSWAERGYIAGRLPNTPDDLVEWLQHTRTIAPDGAMPELGVTERDAWDMAAYLYRPD